MTTSIAKLVLLAIAIGVATFFVGELAENISTINAFFVGFLWGTITSVATNMALTYWSDN